MDSDKKEQFLEDEYERLVSLVGKEKADKYYAETNYPFKIIGSAIIEKLVRDIYTSLPRSVKIIVVIFYCLLLLSLINYLFDTY